MDKCTYRYEYCDGCIREYNFEILRETKCGYWISVGLIIKKEKWVSKTSKKRYAYPTKDEAMINFKTRTKRYMEILKSKLLHAEYALNLAEDGKIDTVINFFS